jgi:hypothetical protein
MHSIVSYFVNSLSSVEDTGRNIDEEMVVLLFRFTTVFNDSIEEKLIVDPIIESFEEILRLVTTSEKSPGRDS